MAALAAEYQQRSNHRRILIIDRGDRSPHTRGGYRGHAANRDDGDGDGDDREDGGLLLSDAELLSSSRSHSRHTRRRRLDRMERRHRALQRIYDRTDYIPDEILSQIMAGDVLSEEVDDLLLNAAILFSLQPEVVADDNAGGVAVDDGEGHHQERSQEEEEHDVQIDEAEEVEEERGGGGGNGGGNGGGGGGDRVPPCDAHVDVDEGQATGERTRGREEKGEGVRVRDKTAGNEAGGYRGYSTTTRPTTSSLSSGGGWEPIEIEMEMENGTVDDELGVASRSTSEYLDRIIATNALPPARRSQTTTTTATGSA